MISDANFTAMIRVALRTTGTVSWELGDFLGVSRLTVERWTEGRNLPYQALREPIERAVDDYVRQKS
jgi:DNA-binding transcriptional regulator YiaG